MCQATLCYSLLCKSLRDTLIYWEISSLEEVVCRYDSTHARVAMGQTNLR